MLGPHSLLAGTRQWLPLLDRARGFSGAIFPIHLASPSLIFPVLPL